MQSAFIHVQKRTPCIKNRHMTFMYMKHLHTFTNHALCVEALVSAQSSAERQSSPRPRAFLFRPPVNLGQILPDFGVSRPGNRPKSRTGNSSAGVRPGNRPKSRTGNSSAGVRPGNRPIIRPCDSFASVAYPFVFPLWIYSPDGSRRCVKANVGKMPLEGKYGLRGAGHPRRQSGYSKTFPRYISSLCEHSRSFIR